MVTIVDPAESLARAEEAFASRDVDVAAANLSAAVRGFTERGDRRRDRKSVV